MHTPGKSQVKGWMGRKCQSKSMSGLKQGKPAWGLTALLIVAGLLWNGTGVGANAGKGNSFRSPLGTTFNGPEVDGIRVGADVRRHNLNEAQQDTLGARNLTKGTDVLPGPTNPQNGKDRQGAVFVPDLWMAPSGLTVEEGASFSSPTGYPDSSTLVSYVQRTAQPWTGATWGGRQSDWDRLRLITGLCGATGGSVLGMQRPIDQVVDAGQRRFFSLTRLGELSRVDFHDASGIQTDETGGGRSRSRYPQPAGL